MENSAQQLVATEQIRADLLQCLDDVEQAALQKRPLRLAYFIARLKSSARNYFLAEESLLGSAGEQRRTELQQNHATFHAYLLMLQEGAIHQNLSIEFVSELRAWGIQHFRCSVLDQYLDKAPAVANDRAVGRLSSAPFFGQRRHLAGNCQRQASLAFP
jgi:hypothetical protein